MLHKKPVETTYREIIHVIVPRHVIALLALVIRQAVTPQGCQADVLIFVYISIQVLVQAPRCRHEGLVVHPLRHLAIVYLQQTFVSLSS